MKYRCFAALALTLLLAAAYVPELLTALGV